jgi:hypothetical protein
MRRWMHLNGAEIVQEFLEDSLHIQSGSAASNSTELTSGLISL